MIKALILLPLLFFQSATFFNQNVTTSSVVQPCGGVECTDNFPGTALGANWTTVSPGVFIVASNQVRGNSSAQSTAAYTGATFTNNQYSCLTLFSGGASASHLGPGVRISSTAVTAYFAEWHQSSATIQLQSIIAGTFTYSGPSAPATVGHEYCLKAVGSTLTVTDNGTVVITGTDTGITSGYAGISAYGNGTSYTGSNWRGGNL
jgi:hypothetical protein